MRKTIWKREEKTIKDENAILTSVEKKNETKTMRR